MITALEWLLADRKCVTRGLGNVLQETSKEDSSQTPFLRPLKIQSRHGKDGQAEDVHIRDDTEDSDGVGDFRQEAVVLDENVQEHGDGVEDGCADNADPDAQVDGMVGLEETQVQQEQRQLGEVDGWGSDDG